MIVIVLLSYLGCSPEPTTDEMIIFSESSFKNYDLRGEEILKNELGVIALHVIDTLVLIEFMEKGDWVYQVYGTQNFSYIGGLGKIGDGPNEWRGPRFSGQTEQSETTLGLWVNDMRHRNFQLIDVYKSIDKSEPVVISSKKYPSDLNMNQNLFYLNASRWVGNLGPNAKERNQLLIYNPLLDTSETIPFSIKVANSELLNTSEQYSTYFTYLALKPDKTKLVSVMNHLSRIDVFDLKNKPIRQSTTVSKEEKHNDLDGEIIKRDRSYLFNYYMWAFATDSYIYALYHGQSGSKYAKDLISTEIRVFDWNGNPVAKLNIPEYLWSFSVDEKNGFIYGVSYFQEKSMRYPFSLNE